MEARRRRAAGRRIDAALGHLRAALAEVQRARADLSAVIGAPTFFSLREALRREIRLAELALADPNSALELDHDPSTAELRVGHGPRHGCGFRKGKG